MKKTIYTTLLTLSLFIAFGQDNKVGINTDTPQETIDVNGTMRIKDVTGENENTILLAVDENGKVMKMSSNGNNFTPFIYKRYKVNATSNGKSIAKNVDLGIDATKYLAILTRASLVKRNYRYGDKDNGAFPLASARLNGAEYSRRIKINGGLLENNNGGDLTTSSHNSPGNVVSLAIPLGKTNIKKTGNTYVFNGDYEDADFIGGHNYSWIVNVLLIDRKWTSTSFFNL